MQCHRSTSHRTHPASRRSIAAANCVFTTPLHRFVSERKPSRAQGVGAPRNQVIMSEARRMSVTMQAIPAEALASIADSGDSEMKVTFDNASDPTLTIITIEGLDRRNLLITLTGALSSAGLEIMSASINSEEGKVKDVFKVQTTADKKQLPESQFESLKEEIVKLTSSSSQSSRPAIYGIIAAAEVDRLRPLSGSASQSEVATLELAAAEMAQAAAELVATEREILRLREKGADAKIITLRENLRAETAAALERKMSAMEAVMAARRTILAEVEEKPKTAAERMMEQFMPPSAGARAVGGAGSGSGYEILFQGFNWESHKHNWYKTLAGQVKDLAKAGFTSVWLPPPSDSVSPQGYLPRDLYKLDTAYGSEQDLRDLISAMHDAGLKAIADVVINHRCAHFQGPDGKWNKFGGRLAWDASVICPNNPAYGGKGNPKQGEDYAAAPNIDHSQERVRNDYIEWLKFLRNSIGYDGWRLDFVRGYLGSYVKTYVDATVPAMAFGEYWDSCDYTDGVLNYNQDSHRQRAVNWCDSTGGTAAAFDFTTKGILQEAVQRREYWRLVDNQGRPPGLMGIWPSRAITFIDNHDTGSTLNHWPFPQNSLPLGYAYILTHPGTPTVFYDHFYQERDGLRKAIKDLLEVRTRNGINCRSKVAVKKAAGDVYAAVIDDKIAMKIGPGDWSPNQSNVKVNGKEMKIACSGSGFAVWEAQH